MDLKKNVRYIKGVGEVKSKQLNMLEIYTVYDLLRYYPQRYEDRKNTKNIAMINDGDTALVHGNVISADKVRLKNRKSLVKVIIEDSSGRLTLMGFNRPYLSDVLKPEVDVYIHGKFERTSKRLQSSHFDFEISKDDEYSFIHMARIVPVYPLKRGISQKWIRRIIYQAVSEVKDDFNEFLPEELIKIEKLISINAAIKGIHFPETFKIIHKSRKTLSIGEFFVFQAALGIKKYNIKKIKKNRQYTIKKNYLTSFKKKLNFEFTNDQKRAINEIFHDLTSPHPMKRLLQGEVGSGKTVVALSALILAVENSYLGVVIAPTEILAEQHYLTFKSYLNDLGIKIGLITGNMKKKERSRILQASENGDINILIGTHALLQEDVNLSNAGIIVIDEQHRFGVNQREIMMNKSENTDVLAMSATPIPRTLAMSSYGDLDISTIKELPKDRKKPVTKHVDEDQAYEFALKELKKGNLVYIVHPLIEDSDKNEYKSVQKRFAELSKSVFYNYRAGLLHGRMGGDEKEEIMRKFSSGQFHVLFTTTVIEVGINVEKATVMIIENFNRYGLATLHQLRGRIARSHRQPYCFLVGDTTTPESRRRLDVMLHSTDGFRIAEEDLKIRGGGELFGTRQSGVMAFKIGDPIRDLDLLIQSRKYAFDLLKADPQLNKKDNKNLRKELIREYGSKFHFSEVG